VQSRKKFIDGKGMLQTIDVLTAGPVGARRRYKPSWVVEQCAAGSLRRRRRLRPRPL